MASDPWALLSRSEVISYLATAPTTEQVELFGSGKAQFIDQITRSGSTMDIGMFGDNQYYFFYMKIKPSTTYNLSGETFEFWFQMGDIESDWTGVSFTASADLVDGTTYACD